MATTQQASESVRTYEIGYLVAPTVPEDEVAEIENQLTDTVTEAGGEMIDQQTPEARDLAYTMEVQTSAGEREFDRAQFGWLQFSVAVDSLDDIEDAVDSQEDVLRFLLITIDPEVAGTDGESDSGEKEDEPENTTDEEDADASEAES